MFNYLLLNVLIKINKFFILGKIKMMFDTLAIYSVALEKLLEKEVSFGEPIFIKETLARFTTDIIGNSLF